MTKSTWPSIQFSSDESVACQLGTNEIQFFDTGDFSKGVIYKLRLPDFWQYMYYQFRDSLLAFSFLLLIKNHNLSQLLGGAFSDVPLTSFTGTLVLLAFSS